MMKCYPIQEAPIKVFGLPLLYETGQYRKLTEDIMEKIPTISQFGMRTTGGRIGFRTDASSFTLRSRLRINGSNEGHSNVSLSGFNVYVGERCSAHFAGCAFIRENTGEFETIEFTFEKKAQMEDVIILCLP